ncbi:MAG: hypothetical protein AAGF93_01715 [Cyanobacteria bacterium P01_H01_bin.105]
MAQSTRIVRESSYVGVERVMTRLPLEYVSRLDNIPGARYSVARALIIKGLEAYDRDGHLDI